MIPNSWEVNLNLGLAYCKISENRLAKHYISSACISKPLLFDNWATYADFLVSTNNFVGALVLYEFILRSKPNLFEVRNKYAKLLFQTDRIKDAKRQLKIALNNAPEFEEGLNNLADIYFGINKFDKAILFYLKALEINPDATETFYNLGLAYFKITEFQKAVEAFEKALRLDPEYFDALEHLSVTYNRQGKMTLSVETFKKCLMLKPDNFDINFYLAMINFKNLDKYEEAEVYFKKCMEINPKRKDVYNHLVSIYRRLKKNVEASNIKMLLGDLYVKDGDQKGAIEPYESALVWNKKNAICHWKLGLLMYNLGQLDMALTRYKDAIVLKPTFAKAYSGCAAIFEKRGNYALAKDYYQAAIKFMNSNMEYMLDLQHKICELDERLKPLEFDDESVETN